MSYSASSLAFRSTYTHRLAFVAHCKGKVLALLLSAGVVQPLYKYSAGTP